MGSDTIMANRHICGMSLRVKFHNTQTPPTYVSFSVTKIINPSHIIRVLNRVPFQWSSNAIEHTPQIDYPLLIMYQKRFFTNVLHQVRAGDESLVDLAEACWMNLDHIMEAIDHVVASSGVDFPGHDDLQESRESMASIRQSLKKLENIIKNSTKLCEFYFPIYIHYCHGAYGYDRHSLHLISVADKVSNSWVWMRRHHIEHSFRSSLSLPDQYLRGLADLLEDVISKTESQKARTSGLRAFDPSNFACGDCVTPHYVFKLSEMGPQTLEEAIELLQYDGADDLDRLLRHLRSIQNSVTVYRDDLYVLRERALRPTFISSLSRFKYAELQIDSVRDAVKTFHDLL